MANDLPKVYQSTSSISDYQDLQNQITQMERQAGKSADVQAGDVDALRQKALDYVDQYKTEFNLSDATLQAQKDQINAKFGALTSIIGENKGSANNAKWQQATTDVDNLMQSMGVRDELQSPEQAATGYQNDWNSTVVQGIGDKADAGTAQKIQNFLDAHSANGKDDLSEDFKMRAKQMIGDINAGKAVTLNDVTALGVSKMTKDGITGSTSQAGGSVGDRPNGISYFQSNVPLPGDLNTLQKTQNVNYYDNAKPPVYITSDNSTPIKYALYDASGKQIELPKNVSPIAIGLGDGNWFASDPKGVQNGQLVADPTTLPSNTQFFDTVGAPAGKLTARTDIKGGKDAESSAFLPQTTLRDDNSRTQTSKGILATQTNQGSAQASVDYRIGGSTRGNNFVTLTADGNKDVTPDAAKNGDYGQFAMANGTTYVSTQMGYFLLNDGVAKDIGTGKEYPADTVMADFHNLPSDQQRDFGKQS